MRRLRRWRTVGIWGCGTEGRVWVSSLRERNAVLHDLVIDEEEEAAVATNSIVAVAPRSIGA